MDAEKLSSEEERKQFAQAVAKIFTYEDSDRSDQESAEDIDIYSFVSQDLTQFNFCRILILYLDWI